MPPFGLQYCPPVCRHRTPAKNITRQPRSSHVSQDHPTSAKNVTRQPRTSHASPEHPRTSHLTSHVSQKHHASAKNIKRSSPARGSIVLLRTHACACVHTKTRKNKYTYVHTYKNKKNKNLLFLGVKLGGALAHGLDATTDTVHVLA